MPTRKLFFLPLLLAGLLAMQGTAAYGASRTKDSKKLKPPKDFVEVSVMGVMDTKGGHAVVLKYEKEGILLPIWIGPSEAFAIQLRLGRQRFQRPLTHDLLDKVMHELGGKLIKIHVDDLKDNTFLGTIFIKRNKKVISIDARPSDSIALAVGNNAPIFVAKSVLDRAGVREEEGEKKQEENEQEGLLKDILKQDKQEHTL